MNSEEIFRLNSFINTIEGKYTNKEQVYNNPRSFAYINIYFRKLPSNISSQPYIYTEQSYNHDLWNPYRQSVLEVLIKEKLIILRNYKIENAQRVAGGGFNPDLLRDIKLSNLNRNHGCNMHFLEVSKAHYKGTLEQGCRCIVKWNSKKTYLSSNVQISFKSLISIDEGFDPITHEKIWGADNGPLEFIKETDSFKS